MLGEERQDLELDAIFQMIGMVSLKGLKGVLNPKPGEVLIHLPDRAE